MEEHRITIFARPASSQLGAAVCNALQVSSKLYECQRFPDGEAQIDIQESVRGRDAYLLQSTSPPVDQHVMELVLLADACRRAGAARLTAIVPYFGYARQDRRSGRRSLGAMAFVHKARLNGQAVEAHAVIGNVRGRLPLTVDDMLSTGATIEAAVGALRTAGAPKPMSVAVTHALLVGRARAILQRPPLANIVVTDSVPVGPVAPPHLDICSVAPLLTTAIQRTHHDESLADLRAAV